MREPKEPSEEDRAEQEARMAMRKMMRKAGIVSMMVFLVSVVFMATLQSVLHRGMTSGAMMAPIAIYLVIGLALTRRGKWGLSLWCLLGLGLHLSVIQESAKTLAMNREVKTKAALMELRDGLQRHRAEHGAYPAALSELSGAVLSPLICRAGRTRTLAIAPGERSNSGAWVYDPATGTVRIDCEALESSGRRWSEL